MQRYVAAGGCYSLAGLRPDAPDPIPKGVLMPASTFRNGVSPSSVPNFFVAAMVTEGFYAT